MVHDLSAGGSYDFVANGVLHTAEADSNSISGGIPYTSNVLTTTVDGAAASKVRRDFHEHAKRQIVQSDCTSTRRTATTTALTNCVSVANGARTAALSGAAAKMTEYFKSSTTTTRNAVAAVFQRVSGECDSSTSGVSREYCTDVYGACSSNVLAYTLPSQSYMVNCPLYFSALPALTRSCHAQDQATTTLHETTHLTQIQGTQDLAYGYAAVTRLSAAQATKNADTFATFANGMFYLSCHPGKDLNADLFFSYLRWLLSEMVGKWARTGEGGRWKALELRLQCAERVLDESIL